MVLVVIVVVVVAIGGLLARHGGEQVPHAQAGGVVESEPVVRLVAFERGGEGFHDGRDVGSRFCRGGGLLGRGFYDGFQRGSQVCRDLP